MKKTKGKIILALSLILVMVFALSSCTVEQLSALLGNETSNPGTTPGDTTNNTSNGDATATTEDYMTRAEVDALIAGIKQEVNVENRDITINSTESKDLFAASKGLLSVVSIRATFDITYTTQGGFFSSPQTVTKQETSGGSGVIYSLDKTTGSAYIITNYHVVYNADSDAVNHISNKINVYLYGKEYSNYEIPATFIGGSMKKDIAVLRVAGNSILKSSAAEAATFADSDDVSVLERAIVIGNPANLGISATVGCVNVDSESIPMTSLDGKGNVTIRVMRVDAAINGGNSGGGLFNEDGQVIGIVNAKISSSSIENIGYAIPSNVAKSVADNVIYYDTQNAANDNMMIATVGIESTILEAWSEYDDTTGKVHKYDKVKVSSVVVGSVAESAGFLAGDIIKTITIDGTKHEITRLYMVSELMIDVRPTSTIVFEIERATTPVTITVSAASLTFAAAG